MGGKKPYQEGSIMHLAVVGFSKIKKLSEGGLISDKLLGLNVLVFVIIMSIDISFWIGGNSEVSSLGYLIGFLVSILFALIVSIVYSPVLELISNFTNKDISALRLGLIVLFIDMPISIAAAVYKSDFLIKISLGLIAFQVILILFGAFIRFSKESAQDRSIKTKDIWLILDKASAICGVLSFILSIILLISGKQTF